METRSSPSPVRATVLADGLSAEYLRAGAGRPVILLGAAAEAPGGWPAIAARLAGRLGDRCRLIVPAAPPPPDALGGWLAAFADGLGVAGVGLVVAEPLAAAARAFALSEPDLVSRLVVLGERPAAADRRESALELVEREGIPLAVLTLGARDAERADGLETLLHFLAGLPLD